MTTSKSLAPLALGILALPFLGAVCTEERDVDLVIGIPTTVTLEADGDLNTHFGADTVNVKEAIDLEAELTNLGITANDIEKDAIKISQVFYRVTVPDPVSDREIVNADLTVVQIDSATGNDGRTAVLVSGWSMNAGVGNVGDPQEWIDITSDIGLDGIDLLNDYLEACVCELQGEPVELDPVIRYEVSGDSVPGDRETGFTYEIRIVFQGTITRTFDVPFG